MIEAVLFISITKLSGEAVIVFDPAYSIEGGVTAVLLADNDLFDSRIQHKALAHHTGADISDDRTALRVGTAHIKCGAQHLISGSGDDRICLCVNRAAKLISFTARNAQIVTKTGAAVIAIDASSGGAVIARGNDDVVLYDNSTEAASQAGTSLRHSLSYIKIVIDFRYSFHIDLKKTVVQYIIIY